MIAKGSFRQALFLVFFFLVTPGAVCFAGDVSIRANGTNVTLTWPSAIDIPGQGRVSPEYTVRSSLDVVHWAPIGGKMRALSGRSGPTLSLSLRRPSGRGSR